MIYLDTSPNMSPTSRRLPGWVTLRTLDVIHLVSALSVRDELTAFCCYDRRLLDTARDAGLPVHAPAGKPTTSSQDRS